jgi:hypothetical protein
MKLLLSVLLISFCSIILIAQPGGGKGGGIPTYTQAEGELLMMNSMGPVGIPPNPDPVPISGIEILLGLGAAFGAKRMISYHRKAKKDN